MRTQLGKLSNPVNFQCPKCGQFFTYDIDTRIYVDKGEGQFYCRKDYYIEMDKKDKKSERRRMKFLELIRGAFAPRN
jgi:hypothetical protein